MQYFAPCLLARLICEPLDCFRVVCVWVVNRMSEFFIVASKTRQSAIGPGDATTHRLNERPLLMTEHGVSNVGFVGASCSRH